VVAADGVQNNEGADFVKLVFSDVGKKRGEAGSNPPPAAP
jgi:hypothetical protein